MRKRIFLCVGLLGLAMFVAGCGNKKETTIETTEEVTEATTEATTEIITEEPTTEDIVVKTIGKQENGAYEIQISNVTGKEIQEILIKASEDEEYSENLLATNDIFAVDEERILYYKGDDIENKEYDIQIVFKDGDSFELHALTFEDFTECELCLEDEVAFVTYKSISDSISISTKDAEIALAANQSNDDDYSYTTLPLAPGEYPVMEVPETQPSTQAPATEAPVTEAPAPEPPASNPDEGCLDDGLFY